MHSDCQIHQTHFSKLNARQSNVMLVTDCPHKLATYTLVYGDFPIIPPSSPSNAVPEGLS